MSRHRSASGPFRVGAVITVGLLLGGTLAAAPAVAGEGEMRIVVFDDAVANPHAEARALAGQHGFALGHVYATAVRGFAAPMSPQAAARLERNPRVRWVEADSRERIVTQTLPTGVDRVEVDRNPAVTTDGGGTAVDLDVAILDTGIRANHADLNVAGGRNFANGPAGSWGDGNGHGTHVAGTVAALDNDIGVVGVAPGALVWAVRVCGNSGFCFASDIIAGIDWVAQQKRSGAVDFAAANFSISSADSANSCANPANATHAAICGLVDEGVPFVLAAGNENREKVPFPVTFSVSAVADFDGLAGGAGAPTCRQDTDDTLANFSNHGSRIDIAAPGVCIESTWNDGGYHTISGTSMAAPHVTGAVALYLHAKGLAPAQDRAGADAIKHAVIGAALPQDTSNHECSYDDGRVGGPLLFANAPTFGGDGTCGVAGAEEPDPGEPDPDDDFVLSVSTYKVRGVNHADLAWNGTEASSFDVQRNGATIATVSGETTYTDDTGGRGGMIATYQVCVSGTTTCTAEVVASW